MIIVTKKSALFIVATLVCVSTIALISHSELSQAAVSDDSGSCGPNLTYKFESVSGTLTISGTGNMKDYSLDPTLIPWYEYRDSIKSVVIGDDVVQISSNAFYECTSLEDVTLGYSIDLETTNGYPFDFCTSILRFHVAEDNQKYTTDDNGILFNKDKTELIKYTTGNAQNSYTVPDTVERIESSAFSSSTHLCTVEISDNVKYVGDDAFANCTSLTTVKIPASVTAIGVRAFANCSSLTSFEVDTGSDTYCSDNGVLFYKDKATLLQYPAGKTDAAYTIPTSVTIISEGAFMGCKFLESVVIPDAVKFIDTNTFAGCTALVKVNIPSFVEKIEGNAFSKCTSLSSITLPSSLEIIGVSAFSECTSLSSIVIPDSVTLIGNQAFDKCSSLVSVKLSDKMIRISEGTFEDCTSLASIIIPSKVQSIGESAFEGCSALTTVNIASQVLYLIDSTAFNYCYGLKEFNVDPESYHFCSDNGVLYDKDKQELLIYPSMKTDTEFILPSSVRLVNVNAFVKCIYLKSIEVEAGSSSYRSENGVLYNVGMTTLIAYPAGKTDASFVMPETLETAYMMAFYGCGLTEITMSDCFGLSSIFVLGMCSSLTDVKVSESRTDLKSVDGVLFSADGKNLEFCPAGKAGAYTVPMGTEVLKKFSFMFCRNLTEVVISDSVVTIESGAFAGYDPDMDVRGAGCESLCKITFGNGLENVVTDSFIGMTFYANGKALYVTADNLKGKTFSVEDGTLDTGYEHPVPPGPVPPGPVPPEPVPPEGDSSTHMATAVAIALAILVVLSFALLAMGRAKKN